jgi:hypothetical protein
LRSSSHAGSSWSLDPPPHEPLARGGSLRVDHDACGNAEDQTIQKACHRGQHGRRPDKCQHFPPSRRQRHFHHLRRQSVYSFPAPVYVRDDCLSPQRS